MKAQHQTLYKNMTTNDHFAELEIEAPPTYETIYPNGVKIGMCSMECGSHWTKIMSEDLGLCGMTLMIRVMKRLTYEFMEACKEEETIDIHNSNICCSGDLDLHLTSRGISLPPIMGPSKMIVHKRETEISDAIVAMMKIWNTTRLKMYSTTYNETGSVNESMILFGDECMSAASQLPSNMAEMSDVIDCLSEDMIMCTPSYMIVPQSVFV
jgi:hypothetical protein